MLAILGWIVVGIVALFLAGLTIEILVDAHDRRQRFWEGHRQNEKWLQTLEEQNRELRRQLY